jgi:hypothetical protein
MVRIQTCMTDPGPETTTIAGRTDELAGEGRHPSDTAYLFLIGQRSTDTRVSILNLVGLINLFRGLRFRMGLQSLVFFGAKKKVDQKPS